MIRIVGFQRILSILLLLGFLVLTFWYSVYYLKPEMAKAQGELSLNQSEISEKTENMKALREGVEKFTYQKDAFEKIQKYGFFDPQDRVEARQRLNAMQKESRLLSAKYTIKSAESEENKTLEEAGYKLLNTEIVFELEAIEDIDVYTFMYLLNYGFPGHVSIESWSLERDKEVTQAMLRQIGTFGVQPLVKAVVKVNWRTSVKGKTQSSSDQEGAR